MTRPYVGRFAPSPTGHLHIGSLFVAVASYLDAKSHGGQWLIRIDDLDPDRCKIEYTNSLISTLAQFELVSDQQIIFQSKRNNIYFDAINQLYEQKQLYPCDCSRKKLSEYGAVYPGFCRQQPTATQWPLAATSQMALRFKIQPATTLRFNDIWHQIQSQNTSRIGDFIVFRRDQVAAYCLATVLDDADQGVTHVIRGSDLCSETFKQGSLQQILQLPQPVYGHLPLIVDKAGRKLSKQNLAPPIRADDPLFDPMRYLAQLEPYLGLQPHGRGQDHPAGWLAQAISVWCREQLPKVQHIIL